MYLIGFYWSLKMKELKNKKLKQFKFDQTIYSYRSSTICSMGSHSYPFLTSLVLKPVCWNLGSPNGEHILHLFSFSIFQLTNSWSQRLSKLNCILLREYDLIYIFFHIYNFYVVSSSTMFTYAREECIFLDSPVVYIKLFDLPG